MDNLERTKENALPEPSSDPNVSSPREHQPNNESLIGTHEKKDSNSIHRSVNCAKLLHLGDSSNGMFQADDHSPKPESSVPMIVAVAGSCTNSDEKGSSILSVEKEALSARNPDILDIEKDETLIHFSEETPSALSEAEPREAALQEPVGSSPHSRHAQTSDDLNVFAGETDTSLVSGNPTSTNYAECSGEHLETVPSVEPNASQLVDSHDDAAFVSSTFVKQNDPSDNKNFQDDTTFVSSPGVRKNDLPNNTFNKVLRIAVGSQPSVFSPRSMENIANKRFQIDTAAPFESVKHAVSKFGGILDWKAHRARTMEKRQIIEEELERAQYEIPSYKKMCEAAEAAKKQVLKELDSTKRLIEEMKIQVEKVQTEELQAKQDAGLAKLRVEEMEQGIAGEASVAARAQLEVAKARHAAAVSELKTVKDELEALRNDYALLVTERDAAVIKAEEAVSASKKVEKDVEDLTIELMTVKESLESAHAAHLEAEEHRIAAAVAREQEALKWEKEAHQAVEEVERLNQKMLLTKDLKSKLDTATALLKDLKAELAAYMESKPKQDYEEDRIFADVLAEPENRNHSAIQAAVVSARKELEEVKMNNEKATGEVDCLQMAATSLKLEIEREKAELATIRQKEGMASAAVASLEAELEQIKSKIAVVQMEEKAAREKMEELPKQLQEAAQEAEQANSVVQMAREELVKAKEELERAKAGASTTQSRLLAAQKEIEAAKSSEKLARAAISALQENESARSTNDEDSPTGVTLSLEQYYELSKEAHEAEEEANSRVAAAMSQVEVAKESELRNLNKLEELGCEMDKGKSALQIALDKAEKAKEAKLGVEQALRQWRAEHEQRRKAIDSIPVLHLTKSPRTSFEERKETKNFDGAPDDAVPHQRLSPKAYLSESKTQVEPSREVNATKKKKRSFFPRFLLFFARKKAQAKSA